MGGSQTSKGQNQSNFTADGCVIVMSAKVKYPDEPLGNLRAIPDFLPLPKNLVFLDEEMMVGQGIIMAGRAKVGLINARFQSANTQNTGDLAGFCSETWINQTFPKKTGHAGPKKGSSAYEGRKPDARLCHPLASTNQKIREDRPFCFRAFRGIHSSAL